MYLDLVILYSFFKRRYWLITALSEADTSVLANDTAQAATKKESTINFFIS